MYKKVALTTIDNPYNPFTEYDKWLNWDLLSGYNTSEILASFTYTSDSLTDEENALEIERAIDEMIDYDYVGIYKKVTCPDSTAPHSDD